MNSCSNTTEPEAQALPIIEQPIIPGIRIVSADANEIGKWGNPVSGPIHIHLYPNPTSGWMEIRFSLSSKSRVTGWVVKGRLAGEKPVQLTNQAGAIVLPTVKKTLLFDREFAAGTWKHDFFSEGYEQGFYRAYLLINGKLTWEDILIVQNVRDFPDIFYSN